jgi:carbamoyl-phosphate synthase small subunit
MEGKLVLADGSEFYGQILDEAVGCGEVVFTTGMTGYQEVLTDPSYCGQIVVMTYPLIGNYGIVNQFDQSRKPFVRGFVIDQLCEQPSNCRTEGTLAEYLRQHKIPCIYGIDTRAVTRAIRVQGTMRGVIVPRNTAKAEIKALLAKDNQNGLVKQVTTDTITHIPANGPRVVVMDFGIKKNILRSLQKSGCDLYVVPADIDAAGIKALNPDGIFLSNGPGDPTAVMGVVETIKELLTYKPIFGICLGHQLLALAFGAKTYKLKFGHRGSNHPVKNLATGRVHITAQNHGYAVDEASLAGLDIEVTHRAVNDGTIEGLRHNSLPIFSVQFHPEASPGPNDSEYLFEQFMSLLVH